jgi:hypothetical protein
VESYPISLILEVLQLLVLDFLELSVLDMNVVLDNPVDRLDVGECWLVVVLDQGLNLHGALPVDSFDVQAKVAVDKSWGSCARGGAVNVDFVLTISH